MKNIITIICFITTLSFAESNICKNVFNIPVYPGLEEAKASNDAFISYASEPTSTRLRVLKTKDESALDTTKIIDFYEQYYRQRGWIDGISKRDDDEPYLSLMIHGHDSSGTNSFIQYAGDLYLWVAPQDGMLTVFMKIRRNSSLKQSALNTLRDTEELLKKISIEKGYKPQRGYQYSWVNEYFQNEYLIESKIYTLNRNSYPAGEGLSHCTDPTGRIHVRLLAYKDAMVASEVAKTLKDEPPTQTGVVRNRWPRLYQREIVQKDFMLILLESRDENQTNTVSQLIKLLE